MPVFQSSELGAWSGGRWEGSPPATLRGISTDTRTIRPGSLYVALRGERFDGHAFADEAAGKGAAAVCVEDAGAPSRAPRLVVGSTRKALFDLAAGYRKTLGMEAIGVTGSVGKTTVKEMIADVLQTEGPTARSPGNWNNDIGLPLSLLSVERDAKHGVFELGMNHPGELAPLSRLLEPAICVVTAIGPVHIGFFDSVDDIAREKGSILQALPGDGMAVLSRDDPYFDLLRGMAPGRVTTVSLGGRADVSAVLEKGRGNSFRAKDGGGESVFRLSLPGEYMVRNALFAIAVGRSRGMSWEDLRAVIEPFRPPGMRWKRETVAGVTVVNDAYNANPVSMRAALNAFADEPAEGRRWLVLAAMRELGRVERREHEELGRFIAGGAWAGLITVGEPGRLIANGAKAGGMGGRVRACRDHAEAAAALKEGVRPGDAVLLKASRGEALENVVEMWKGMDERKENSHAGQ